MILKVSNSNTSTQMYLCGIHQWLQPSGSAAHGERHSGNLMCAVSQCWWSGYCFDHYNGSDKQGCCLGVLESPQSDWEEQIEEILRHQVLWAALWVSQRFNDTSSVCGSCVWRHYNKRAAVNISKCELCFFSTALKKKRCFRYFCAHILSFLKGRYCFIYICSNEMWSLFSAVVPHLEVKVWLFVEPWRHFSIKDCIKRKTFFQEKYMRKTVCEWGLLFL